MIDTRSPVLEFMIDEERVSEKEKGHKALLKQFLQGAPDYFPLGNMVFGRVRNTGINSTDSSENFLRVKVEKDRRKSRKKVEIKYYLKPHAAKLGYKL